MSAGFFCHLNCLGFTNFSFPGFCLLKPWWAISNLFSICVWCFIYFIVMYLKVALKKPCPASGSLGFQNVPLVPLVTVGSVLTVFSSTLTASPLSLTSTISVFAVYASYFPDSSFTSCRSSVFNLMFSSDPHLLQLCPVCQAPTFSYFVLLLFIVCATRSLYVALVGMELAVQTRLTPRS